MTEDRKNQAPAVQWSDSVGGGNASNTDGQDGYLPGGTLLVALCIGALLWYGIYQLVRYLWF